MQLVPEADVYLQLQVLQYSLTFPIHLKLAIASAMPTSNDCRVFYVESMRATWILGLLRWKHVVRQLDYIYSGLFKLHNGDRPPHHDFT